MNRAVFLDRDGTLIVEKDYLSRPEDVVLIPGAGPALKKLADALGAPRFSFGNAELLYEVLGVRPGSVTPFALANDSGHRVTVVLDRAMLGHDPLNYHPLENDRTTAIAPADLSRFIAACGHTPRIIDIEDCEGDAAAR